MNLLADPFAAIADDTRRLMLRELADGERSVGDLVERFALPQPAVSKHLKVLRDAGLVRVRVEHRHRYYALEAAPLAPVLDWVRYFERFWTARLDALGDHLRKKRRS
ncbi:MAG TPA: metalloregulator ArsR/SmtB family transcription factor [Nannocystaceae bacterium]|nr:metalloregulator ArsR/SmtB family transcription factor [Nannocystaceae bacterium]